MTRGSPSSTVQHLSSPSSFARLMSTELPASVLATPRQWRPRRTKGASSSLPHYSVRLAKKAASHPPVVMAAQNLLMCKLGLISSSSLEASDFELYINIFMDGFTEEQAEQIDNLLMAQVLPSTQIDEVVS
jgi:hypothetical protein